MAGLKPFTVAINKGEVALVVLFTKEAEPGNFTEPDEVAKMRVAKSAEFLRLYPNAKLVIIGGYPDVEGISLAERLERYIQREYPDIASRIILVRGDSNNTVADLQGMAESLKKGEGYENPTTIKIFYFSRPGHCRRIALVLKRLGYRCIGWADSGESRTLFDAIVDFTLYWATFLDPFQRGWIGRKVASMADTQAAIHHQESKRQLANRQS